MRYKCFSGNFYRADDDSRLKRVRKGLVDYLKDGFIIKNGEEIPCQIGFTDFGMSIEPTHIFIEDGISENGTHYYKETVKL